jgi:exopolysaccharide biosynthesis polyprenyl glycosylphosphotransferase
LVLTKICSDIIAYFIATYLSILFYDVSVLYALEKINYILILSGLLLYIISIYNYGGYRYSSEFSRLNEITSLLKSAFFMILLSVLVLFFFRIDVPIFVNLTSQLIFLFSLLILPSLLRTLIKSFFSINILKESVFLIGFGEMGKSFMKLQASSKVSKFNIVGIFDDKISLFDNSDKLSIIGNFEQIDQKIKEIKIDRIIVAVRNISSKKIDYIQSIANKHQISLNFLPSIESFESQPKKLKYQAGIPLISKNSNSQSFFYKTGKRTLDLILAIIISVLVFPVLIIITILIKKNSEGSCIFSQDRIGLNGKTFKLYKFRSMYINTPKYGHSPSSSSDDRVTKVGRWLRKTSLDELPQLINIIKNDMSLVGPRPEMPFIVNNYSIIEKQRLIVKPGLTGLWQVSPYRDSEINHNLEYDFYYIENQGFILDFVILFMTLFFTTRGITN